MLGIRILGTGSYVPNKIITNDDYAAFLETSDEWIRTRTGMASRHISENEPCWYMGAQAAKEALAAADLAPDDIDMIIGTTSSGDYFFPSMASCVQNAIGTARCISLDISVACTGIAFAIDMARRYLATGDVKRVLIVASEMLSQLCDYTDRSTCVLFGDAAGALIVEAAEVERFASFQSCDSSGGKYLYYRHPRQTTPFTSHTNTTEYDQFEDEQYGKIVMNGREVYKFATKAMPEAVVNACEKAGVTPEEINVLFVHQANIRIIETAAKNLGIPMERIYTNIDRVGNASSATMATCLDECVRAGGIKRGDTICFVGFGAGLSYGAVVMQY